MNINNTDFMKKILLSMLSLLVSMTMFAQSEAVRKMNLVYDGQVVYSRSVSLIDSIKFVWEETGDDVIGGGEVDGTKQLYVGVVAFNQNVRQMPITSDVEAVKAFINEQTNDKDFTSFAYSVSKGNQMFDAEALPAFDKIFMLNFSDGTDNYSNMKWGEEGRMVSQRNVYDTARYDLQQRDGLNSYALGFGNDVGFGANMKKVVMGSGSYFNVTSANELQSTFNEIAKSMLASAKNVLLKTNPGYYVGGDCKYFRFTFTAEGGYTDTIYAQMEGYPAVGYTLTISKVSNNYAYFDAPAKGVVDNETGKVHIPLNNLKFTKDGEELQYKFVIEVSFDGELYYEDVEEASTAEEIDKRIAVVLVLDCSTSMGDAFAPMKAAAVNFIETMEKMEVDDSEPNIPDVPNTGNHEYVDLGLPSEKLRFHDHEKLAFYAKAACDIFYLFPMGWSELNGIHHRSTHDLSRHQEFSGKSMQYMDPVTNEKFIPTVIEYSIGADRLMLAVLSEAYTEETLTDGNGKEDTDIFIPSRDHTL